MLQNLSAYAGIIASIWIVLGVYIASQYYTNRHKKVIYSELFLANEFETNNLSNSGSIGKLFNEEVGSPKSAQRASFSTSDTV
ncbi:hypothetical protein [Shewanella waksmanii]|uniref:hypothetical protein n=1 Tax=Shewanella waksmanii TaxID=213783 RepID=UPI0037364AF9